MNRPTTRRQLLQRAGCGFGSLALSSLLQDESMGLDLHHAPRAKRVIFVFMQGGPSQVDTFDYKPQLDRDHERKVPFFVARTRQRTEERVFRSPWKFARYGETGQWVSELFPHQAKCVDDFCLIRSMHTEGVAHGPATLFLHTGATNLIRPAVGSWITYGLGSENQNLPGFVSINPPPTKGGPRNYSNAFLPTEFQGTALGRAGLPVSQATIKHLQAEGRPPEQQRRQLDLLHALNREQMGKHPLHDELEAKIESFELAFRMQQAAPSVLDLNQETQATHNLYGLNRPETREFGAQCLLARRLSEAGVRYVQVNYADNSNNPRWDQHSNLKQHEKHALATDQPVAALLQDLKQRGLLDDTLVWWGGEFGRTPFAQGKDGRDHNPNGFSIWLAGGGVRRGLAYGSTDEHGYLAVENKVHMHDLHATLLHLLGVDHTRLTYRFAGRDFRLTDVHGTVVQDILA